MKKTRNKFILPFLIVALVWGSIGFIVLSKIGSGDKAKTFIESLPQLKNIDTSKEVCFEMDSKIAWQSDIDCFIPNDFEAHTQNVENIEAYKTALLKSSIANVRPVEQNKKSAFLKFYDSIQPNMSVIEKGKYAAIRKNITDARASSSGADSEIRKEYIYLLSLEGKYKEAQKEYRILCSEFPSACSKGLISFNIVGAVHTDKWLPVENANIRVLGGTGTAMTDSEGKYVLKFESFPGQKIRLEAFKPGFSNANFSLDILSEARSQNYRKDFTLNTPVQFAVIDTLKNTISGENTGVKDGNFTIKTQWSDYRIPFGSLVHKDGKAYKGKVTAYFFEFDKQSQNQDLLQNDIFDDVVGYAGNLMKTFGMPYVLFVTDDAERIDVLKDHPMVLQSKIMEMEALRTNKDRIYSPLTDEDMKFLVDESKKIGGYPVDREFLIKNNLLRYPIFWVFDQSKGIWINQGTKVISTDGVSEILFYTRSEIQQ